MTRVCTHCGEEKDIQDFSVHHDKGGVLRFRNVCKACYNAQCRARYKPHPSRKTPAKYTAEQYRKDMAEIHPESPVKVKETTPVFKTRPTPASGDPTKFTPDIKDLVTAYLNITHWRPINIGTVSLQKFNKHYNLEIEEDVFKDIEQKAAERLEEYGYYNDYELTLNPSGTYLVVGDSFGTHTPDGVFRMLRVIVQEEHVDGVIFIGHNLDDENMVSNLIGTLGVDTYVLPIRDELRDLHAQRDYGYHIIQDRITIGDIIIRNQEHITPYVKTYIGNLDPMMFGGKMIVNCTRQELAVRPTPDYEDSKYFIASPGCLADPHVVSVINRLIFCNGTRAMLRPTNKDSYHKHRKNETDKLLWERGYILVRKGKVYQRRIFKTDKEYRTIVNGGVMSSQGCHIPSELTLVLSDIHAPYSIPAETLSMIVEHHSLVNRIIFNGDVLDMRSFNPHNPEEATRVDLQNELNTVKELLELMVGESGWHPWNAGGMPPRIEFLMGNHEDFMERWLNKWPQFASCFKTLIWDVLTKYGTITGDEQAWATIGKNTIVTHGSADIFGVSGNNMEKTARTFQKQTIIGHTHSPAIRFGSYRTGCLCDLTQGYNNPRTSNWEIGYARVYDDTEHEYVELVNL